MNPSDGIAHAEQYFDSMKLDFPYIPPKEKAKIRRLQPELFSTRDLQTSPYDIESYVHEVLSEKISNYVLFGFAGHGVLSRAIHYYIVNEHLALFIQLSYGNASSDQKVIRDRIEGIFHSIKLFFEKIDKANIPKGKRLLIIESDIYGRGWGWIKGQPGEIAKDIWHTNSTLLEALNDIPSA